MHSAFMRYRQCLQRLALAVLLPLWSFAGAADAPVDFVEIEHRARFAAAAYAGETEVRALLEAEGYTLSLYHMLPEIRLTFYLATSQEKQSQIIAVRGTANAENAMLDLAFKLVADDKAGVRLHDGFAYATRQVYQKVEPLLENGYRIHSTGHSLGGAVAQILAMYLDADGYEVGPIVTFGQPKVTNLPGAAAYAHLDLLRVVTPADLVPLMPPFDPLDLENIDIYWHAGREILLLDGGRYAVLEGIDSMLRAASFTQQPPSEENLKNHFMPVYLELVGARIHASERVEYRNDLNLFNLFGKRQGG